jgi:hypothetical protein
VAAEVKCHRHATSADGPCEGAADVKVIVPAAAPTACASGKTTGQWTEGGAQLLLIAPLRSLERQVVGDGKERLSLGGGDGPGVGPSSVLVPAKLAEEGVFEA